VKNPFRKLTRALNGPDDYPSNKSAHPVFIAGIKYPSIFQADTYSGIRAVSIWKAMRRSGGGPAQITPVNGTTRIIINRESVLVVMEVWVITRTTELQKRYGL
jgi:hypothetical protein